MGSKCFMGNVIHHLIIPEIAVILLALFNKAVNLKVRVVAVFAAIAPSNPRETCGTVSITRANTLSRPILNELKTSLSSLFSSIFFLSVNPVLSQVEIVFITSYLYLGYSLYSDGHLYKVD